ncbi:hypothetical protein A0H81_13678 [Grifola frondosa]|uniref:Uncharacterized protein n=1 Tax=Grifola frondosa TaxID=5627 RepID=A0A1C7LPL1_GRIFR|nr:hypothetical protein A0H81_13678 [Grifola frondosa]
MTPADISVERENLPGSRSHLGSSGISRAPRQPLEVLTSFLRSTITLLPSIPKTLITPAIFWTNMAAASKRVFGPVPEPGLPWKPTVIPPGARYCEELDAFVPANRPYGIRGIAKRRAPLMERVRTGELFHVESKDEQMTMAFGLTHKTIMLVPLMHAQQSAEIKYRGLEGSENKRVERMTSANGTIHKGLTLVPLEQAQKNVEIKYRGFY